MSKPRGEEGGQVRDTQCEKSKPEQGEKGISSETERGQRTGT